MFETQVQNSKGDGFVSLTEREAHVVNSVTQQLNQIENNLGYEIDITTLTGITKRITEQKFFEIAPADYMPVKVGDHAWSSDILTYRDFSISSDFEEGNINTGTDSSRLASASSNIDSITVPVINWAKQIGWSVFDLRQASRSGNWDLVSSKERSRKYNWDLGIQRIAFLGSRDNSEVDGLLTQSDVTANTTVIPTYIRSMNVTQYSDFVEMIIAAYRANSQNTAYPTHFIIPEADYNGLVAPVAEGFPIVSKLEYLEKALKTATRNPNFKIMPLAYADQGNNSDVTGLNRNRYTLLRYDEESGRMDIPVDYTNTLQNTVNGFQFENVGYGQYTGYKAYRPREHLYFDWS